MTSRYPKQLSVWLPDDVADALERLAETERVTVSHVMRQILGSYLVYVGAIKPQRSAVNGTDEIRAVGGDHLRR